MYLPKKNQLFGVRPPGHGARLCLAHAKFFQVYGQRLIRVPLTTEAIHAHRRSASWLWVGWCNMYDGIMEQQRIRTRFFAIIGIVPLPCKPPICYPERKTKREEVR
jgi:hypothetical protein